MKADVLGGTKMTSTHCDKRYPGRWNCNNWVTKYLFHYLFQSLAWTHFEKAVCNWKMRFFVILFHVWRTNGKTKKNFVAWALFLVVCQGKTTHHSSSLLLLLLLSPEMACSTFQNVVDNTNVILVVELHGGANWADYWFYAVHVKCMFVEHGFYATRFNRVFCRTESTSRCKKRTETAEDVAPILDKFWKNQHTSTSR